MLISLIIVNNLHLLRNRYIQWYTKEKLGSWCYKIYTDQHDR